MEPYKLMMDAFSRPSSERRKCGLRLEPSRQCKRVCLCTYVEANVHCRGTSLTAVHERLTDQNNKNASILVISDFFAFEIKCKSFMFPKRWFSHAQKSRLRSLQCGQALTESQNRVTAIIRVISWQPISLCCVSEAANRINVKEMKRRLQGAVQVRITSTFPSNLSDCFQFTSCIPNLPLIPNPL